MATRKVTRARSEPKAEAVDVEVELDDAPDDAPEPSAPASEPRIEPARTAHGALVTQSRSGRYELAYELASGGMATVYLARFEGAASFSRAVALKRIHRHLARDRRFVDMFLDEARISARLSHPNVCAVTDFGQDDEGGYYLAMEYLAGETLASVMRAALRRDPDAPADPRYRRFVAYLLAEAARGLQAAHDTRGADGRLLDIVHRDVTPNNLFVTFDGVLKVVDFGIAKARDRVTQTDTGELKGSLPYVSPEQARSAEADRRADVWSLGVCAWEALTGKRLFKRQAPADTLYAVLEAPIPRITEVRPGIPEAYADVVEAALQREPSDRYGSARAMGDALMQASEADPPRPSASDIAAWLDELFPGGRQARRELVEGALRGESRELAIPREASASASEAATVAAKVTTAAAPPTPRRGAMAIAAGAIAVVLVGGIAWQMRSTSGSGSTSPSGTTSISGPGSTSISGSTTASPPSTALAMAPAPAPSTAPAPSATPAPAPSTQTAPAPSSHSSRRPHHDAPPSTAPTPPASRAPSPPPSRPPPSSSSSSSGDGLVVIVVPDGWAEVYDGSRRLGTTPLRTSLPSGGHDLDVRIEGHAPGRRVHADVRGGETTRLVVRASE